MEQRSCDNKDLATVQCVHCLLPAVYLHNKLEWKPLNHTFYHTHTCSLWLHSSRNASDKFAIALAFHFVKVEFSFVSFLHLALAMSEQSQLPSNIVRILVIASTNHRYPLNATLYRKELSHICLQVYAAFRSK